MLVIIDLAKESRLLPKEQFLDEYFPIGSRYEVINLRHFKICVVKKEGDGYIFQHKEITCEDDLVMETIMVNGYRWLVGMTVDGQYVGLAVMAMIANLEKKYVDLDRI